ncbi:GDP-mannose 4,6-dehydratase [Caulobacter sp. 602-2]|uniref:GDP-mannose 4,6-dehydratase n=1 Tax=Caulobacter sp. 602-2 TaxID=2710887 RepID=A0A6G4QZ77_9CAUL|nr:GDP-mannose 4,6-dehydratase [Caulobacter sp. 602-2]NGM50238.1 GDP-mannose 4,6-dehydratase [Caulobacter sp. 602-2]
MKRAVVTGVTGQDGAYLCRRLIQDGFEVIGTYRRGSSVNFWRLDDLGLLQHPKLSLAEYDLLDIGAAYRLIERSEPTHVFNLAAQSFVGVSFDQPVATAQMTGVGPLNLLEAIRGVDKTIRFYQASSSEMFGLVQAVPQDENTPFYPRSPYAAAKLFAHWLTVNYRESYGMFATSGILFNHESPLRGQEFVTRKITNTVARISQGKESVLRLGNLDAQRDWGYADEFVDGMCRILDHHTPDTFVLSTNKTTTVRRFVEIAFEAVGVTIGWTGAGVDEKGVDDKTGKVLVEIDERFFRPAEVDLLLGSYQKAHDELGWRPETTVEQLCKMMVTADLQRNERGFSF